jgi:2-polyprenyl-3-methyl-5-hydroxy-6-metoxy-1,4-benzoquinol methylase
MRKEGDIDWKGEREVGRNIPDIDRRHIDRYNYVLRFIEGKNVLDIACGCGYGSNMISKKAKSVIGADISGEAVNYAKEHWSNDNTSFHVFDLGNDNFENYPFENVDTIVSIETIEHIEPPPMVTCKKFYDFLPVGGILVLSHPNNVPFKRHYHDGGTSWHLHFSIDAEELTKSLVDMGFKVIDRHYQPNKDKSDLKRNHLIVLEKGVK